MPPRSLKLAVALALGLIPGASFAQTVEQAIIDQLAQQGFTRISVSRTLLGRTLIRATSGSMSREIVFNPTTGVILRDYWEDLDDDDDDGSRLINPRSSSTDRSGVSSPSSSSNKDNDDDDDDDDDDDRDRDRNDDDDDDDDRDDRDDRDDDDDDN